MPLITLNNLMVLTQNVSEDVHESSKNSQKGRKKRSDMFCVSASCSMIPGFKWIRAHGKNEKSEFDTKNVNFASRRICPISYIPINSLKNQDKIVISQVHKNTISKSHVYPDPVSVYLVYQPYTFRIPCQNTI